MVQKPGSIKERTWYTAKIELSSGRIRCWLDDEMIFDYEIKSLSISVSSTMDKSAGEVIVKLVNPTEEDVDVTVSLNGGTHVNPSGTLQIIAGSKLAKNSRQNPDAVKTRTEQISVGKEFEYTMPAMSVQFIRIGIER